VERGLAETTVSAYLRELRALGDLRPRLQTEALRSLLHSRGGSAGTVSRRIAAWRSYYRWAVRTEQRTDDPTVGLDRPKVLPGLPKPIEDVDAVLIRLDPVMQAIALFLLESGLRISEACAVNVPLPVPQTIRVKGKGGKTRLVPLSHLAREALGELGGRIPLAMRTVQRRFQLAGTHAHAFRHTFATDLLEDEIALEVVQDLLGHASPATTRIYGRVSERRLHEAVDRRHRLKGEA
jgi:site-specific recombinase XerD